MNTIIYLHGYGSNSNSHKGQVIKNHFKDMEVITPNLPEKPSEAFKVIWKVLGDVKNPIVVGSSLGGFYADYFGWKADIPTILINPLTDPAMIESFFGEAEFEYLVRKNNERNSSKNLPIAPQIVLIAKDDELLPFERSIENLNQDSTRMITTFSSGGHRFENHDEDIISAVDKMISIVGDLNFYQPFSEGISKLEERFVTALPGDIEMKIKLLPVVAPMIDTSYKSIGGFVGEPEVLESGKVIDKLLKGTLWKLVKRDDKIVAGVIYASKVGRKGICLFTNGTPVGKAGLKMIVQEDDRMRRAWIEVSGSAERFYSRNHSESPLPKEEAEAVLAAIGKKAIKWHADGYHYDREINGQIHTKSIYGNADIKQGKEN